MNQRRLILWVTLGLIYLMVYQAWVADYGPKNNTQTSIPSGSDQAQLANDTPSLPAPQSADLPALNVASAPAANNDQTNEQSIISAGRVKVSTDVVTAEIDLAGGDLRYLSLDRYPVSKKEPDQPVLMLRDQVGASLAIAQSGLLTAQGLEAPTHQAVFSAKKMSYKAAAGSEQLAVPLFWQSENGELTVTKTYIFYPGQYRIDVRFDIDNRSQQDWMGAPYTQLQYQTVGKERSISDVSTYSFSGPVFFDGKKYEKLKPKELRKGPIQSPVKDGWLAKIQHHFLAAIVPNRKQVYQLSVKPHENGRQLLSAVAPLRTIVAGSSSTVTESFFIGPKMQNQLSELHPKLKLSVDYGVLTVLSQPLFWLLEKIFQLVKNWGWAIVIVTVLIKTVFYKLTETSYRSMAKIRALQPRMKLLQERFKDDRKKLSQAMMKMYQEEKVNPAAGCLPLLVQMPVFLAFYWMLIETVELRQAPFIGWITDLSSRDPYFILPILMGVAMIVQYKLNPKPTDPMQAKIFGAIPYVFAVFFALFPAGLVLYWLVNTVLGVIQQQYINHQIAKEMR